MNSSPLRPRVQRLPDINAGNCDLPEVSELAWRALRAAENPPTIFRYAGLPMRLEGGGAGEPPKLCVVDDDRLCHRLARVARWYRYRSGGVKVAAHPPRAVVRDMLADPRQSLPLLARLTEVPVLRADGTVLDVSGYDQPSKIYFSPGAGFRTPRVPDTPTGDEVRRARELLVDDLLGDFPFTTDADRAHAVALLLLPFVRELIDGPTPLHIIEKPAPGTGATLLANVIALIATGHHAALMTEASNEEEWRKRLTATLLESPTLVVVDNLRRALDSAALSSAITATVWKDRRLGASETIHAPVRCAWIATANNPTLSSEISRRTVRIRLEARSDRPWLRGGFRHPDLIEWVIGHRPDLVGATLTLARAWIATGRAGGTRSLGMFEAWARVTGGLLDATGIDGFLNNSRELYEASDSESDAWRRFVDTWWDNYGAREVGVADLWKLIDALDEEGVDLGLGDGGERSRKIRLGKALGRMRDRRFGCRQILAVRTLQGAQQWRLRVMSADRP